jgi:hypothetical protein
VFRLHALERDDFWLDRSAFRRHRPRRRAIQ